MLTMVGIRAHENTNNNEKMGFEDQQQDEGGQFDDAEPIGDVIRVSHAAGEKRNHFQSFEFDGNLFQLGNSVLVAPEEGKIKPSVAIIKDIFQTESGDLVVRGQRFYRPEEVEKRGGGTWESDDARELFFSSQVDELDAITVMHKCIIHLVPFGKTVPNRKQHPGFIVQKVYDVLQQKLRYLVGSDCEGMLLPPVAA